MGFLDDLFDPKPEFVKPIVAKINSYLSGMNPDVVSRIRSDAIFYAEKKSNWDKVSEQMRSGKDSEYFALLFVSLATRDVIRSGEFHIYAGIVSAEGMAACGIFCDCVDRLVALRQMSRDVAENAKAEVKAMLNDIGIG